MFVSIHVPKTAGTALAKIFDETSGRKVLFDYGTERDLVSVRTCDPELKKHKEFIESYFHYLHGHFHYLKYFSVFPDARYIATVRNPVSRIISQYEHILRAGDRQVERHRMIMDGEMGLLDFARIDFIANAHWYYLEGRDVTDYDFVFVQERMGESVRRFSESFHLPAVAGYIGLFGDIPRVNAKPSNWFFARRPRLSRTDKKEIEKFCFKDNEIYRLASEMLDRR